MSCDFSFDAGSSYRGFYFMILVTVLILVLGGAFNAAMTAKLLAEVLYLQSYIPGVWNHTWSLAVEEHFYVLLAVSLFVVASRYRRGPDPDPFRRFLRVAALIVLAITVGRSLTPYVSLYVYGRELDPTHLQLQTHARIDTLTVGVILSYLYHFQRVRLLDTARRHRTVLAIASVVLLMPPFFWPLDQSAVMPSVGLLCIAVGFAGILLVCLASTGRTRGRHAIIGRVTSSLASIGFHSYSIYLWHMPVQVALMPIAAFLPATATPDVKFAFKTSVYLVAAVIVGLWTGRLIEQPALSLRDRLFPTRAGGLAGSARLAGTPQQWVPITSSVGEVPSRLPPGV
jgi:peptidoglycan/LPS O-acetylase OafA/YrhL